MTLDLWHLRYFVAVAEEGHITRAAERLGIQQPPLSQRIKIIEQELGVQLFRRKARGVELTDAGRTLLEEARLIMEQFERARDATQRAARGELGRLCVGMTSTGSLHPLVPRTIRMFHEASPQIAITVEECLSNELIERLRSERMDVAFTRIPHVDAEGLVVYPLLREAMVAAMPTNHPLAKGKGALPMARMANETFILAGPPGTGMYDAIIAACHAAGFDPRVGNLAASTQQGPRITSTLSLVSAGLGISFVPESLQRMNLEGVVFRRVEPGTQPTAPLNLVARLSDASAIVRRFLDLVRGAAKDFRAS